MWIIPEKPRRVYKVVYRESLMRNFFCVSDKVDVSGTTFTAVFSVLYSYQVIDNLFFASEVTNWSFYRVGFCWFIYLMFSLTAYRDPRELCFYCKFALSHPPVVLLLMMLFYMNTFPWPFFVFAVSLFLCVALNRYENNKERAKEIEMRKKRIAKHKQR